MGFTVPIPPPNIMLLCACPSSDATLKCKAVATPTRPTPPRNDHLTSPPTVATGTNFAPGVRNPYIRSSMPHPNPRFTIAVTPSSSAKKTSGSSPAPLISRKKKSAPQAFTLVFHILNCTFPLGLAAWHTTNAMMLVLIMMMQMTMQIAM
eukprot:scaffold43272_cov55-Attheya_sp.AAC.1